MAFFMDRLDGDGHPCFDIHRVTGAKGGECFLFITERDAFMVDTGFGFCADTTVENIKKYLGDRQLDHILLTHSHYDHCLGSAGIREAYPGVEVMSSEHCAQILDNLKARQFMRKLDMAAANAYGQDPGPDRTAGLHTDRKLADGEEFELGDLHVRAIALPGHTKCSMGFYFPDQKFLVSCESIGLYAGGGTAAPGCVSSCRDTLASLVKVRALDISQMLVSHNGIIYDDDVRTFLESCDSVTRLYRDVVVSSHRKGMADEEILEIIRKTAYTPVVAKFYPVQAFNVNTKAQIAMFIRESEEA